MTSILFNKISACFPISDKRRNEISKTFSPVLKTLEKDTVSFSGNNPKPNLKTLDYFASRIYIIGTRIFPEFHTMCSNIFGKNMESARIKPITSIINKLTRRINPEEKLTVNKSLIITKDLLASRAVTDGTHKSTKEIVEKLCLEIKKGTCVITEIRNYRGVIHEKNEKYIVPYFSEANINKIRKIQNQPISVITAQGKESQGYTATHIIGNIKGVPFELQIKGRLVKIVDDGTHMLHNIDIGKYPSPEKEIPKEIKEIQNIYKNLTSQNRKKYDNYVAKYYNIARTAEIKSEEPVLPVLPKGIAHELDIPNLIQIAKKYGHI